MDTNTPRTDAEENRIQCNLSSMKLDDWNAAYHEMKDASPCSLPERWRRDAVEAFAISKTVPTVRMAVHEERGLTLNKCARQLEEFLKANAEVMPPAGSASQKSLPTK